MDRDNPLTSAEARVLGSLLEKKMATPEYYPLSLVSLTAACNQKSNRDPVVVYDEEIVLQAVDGLEEKKMAWTSHVSRVPKVEECFDKDQKLTNQEAAVMCVLLLRGPQTVGEIRTRTHRLHKFDNLDEVDHTLKSLVSFDLVVRMPRRPGQKEARYHHLLCGPPETEARPLPEARASSSLAPSVDTERLDALEEKIASLSSELEELKQAFMDFKGQFE